jgi:glycosyltransferase involved in cell wall biosynthesis
VSEGETGWTFAPGSVTALADRLRLVASLGDRQVADVGAAARARVVREFGPERYVEGIRQLYSELGVTWH